MMLLGRNDPRNDTTCDVQLTRLIRVIINSFCSIFGRSTGSAGPWAGDMNWDREELDCVLSFIGLFHRGSREAGNACPAARQRKSQMHDEAEKSRDTMVRDKARETCVR